MRSSSQITWQGIAITVTCGRNALGLADVRVATSGHLSITAEGAAIPCPSRYLSLSLDSADIDAVGAPAAYVLAWSKFINL